MIINITSGVERVTPEKAQKWLGTSLRNRRIYDTVVDRYARELAAGTWAVNGEAITFDSEGHLCNGHHRLQACIKSGVSFDSLVVRGVAPAAFETYDSGRRRSPADVFAIEGKENAGDLAAVLQLLWRFEKGVLSSTTAASAQELSEVLNRHPHVPRSLEQALLAKRVMSVSVLAFVHALAAERGEVDAADLFVEALSDGVNLAASNPARLLRDRCLMAKTRNKGRISRTVLLALTIKAMNYFAADEPLSQLLWAAYEPFPTPGLISKGAVRAARKRRTDATTSADGTI